MALGFFRRAVGRRGGGAVFPGEFITGDWAGETAAGEGGREGLRSARLAGGVEGGVNDAVGGVGESLD
jgi:hypothetical protein